jgi:hypothetical protein
MGGVTLLDVVTRALSVVCCLAALLVAIGLGIYVHALIVGVLAERKIAREERLRVLRWKHLERLLSSEHTLRRAEERIFEEDYVDDWEEE